MTVRIAKDLGINKIINFSKTLGIYDNPDELLSISLGSAETTLLKLTSAYSVFVNGGKLVKPILIDRIQDSEGKTIFNNEKRKCINCEKISYLGKEDLAHTPSIGNLEKQTEENPEEINDSHNQILKIVKDVSSKGLVTSGPFASEWIMKSILP